MTEKAGFTPYSTIAHAHQGNHCGQPIAHLAGSPICTARAVETARRTCADFRLLQDSVGCITPNTLNIRIKELRGAGLVIHDDNGYLLTDSGIDLLKPLLDLQPFAMKWQASRENQAAR